MCIGTRTSKYHHKGFSNYSNFHQIGKSSIGTTGLANIHSVLFTQCRHVPILHLSHEYTSCNLYQLTLNLV